MKKAPIQVNVPRARHRAAGFSLLELMVALTVLGIGLGIAVPSFTDMTRRNRLATQTNSLMSALAIARSEAVKRGVAVTVCPAQTGSDSADQCSGESNWAENGWIVFTDAVGDVGEVSSDADAATDDAILQRIPAAADQNIRVANNAIVSLTYRQDGMADLPPGTITTFVLSPQKCKDPDGAREVEVIAAGRAGFRKVSCPAQDGR
jgi:type IV fimbrial biogenesis protein FimT